MEQVLGRADGSKGAFLCLEVRILGQDHEKQVQGQDGGLGFHCGFS